MDKNLLKFYLLALPLILLTFVYMQWDTSKKQRAWREANPEAAKQSQEPFSQRPGGR